MSAWSRISPSSRKRAESFSPNPSMSMTAAKCLMCWKTCPGQPRRFGHIVKTASAGLTVGVPQRGHLAGGLGFRRRLPLRRCTSGEIT